MFSTHIAFTEQDQSCFNSGHSDIKLHQVNKQHNQYEKYFLNNLIDLFREEDYEALADILERSRL